MRQFKVINRLKLNEGVLMCKKPSGRSYQKAHFKQGDLDGACGAYSVAMVLNILGVFEAEEICSDNVIRRSTDKWKLIKALNDEGLYREGLTSGKIKKMLSDNYSGQVSVQLANKAKGHNITDIAKNRIDNDNPVILGFVGKKFAHWVVAVGYIEDENNDISDILVLDPGSESPKYALWNGILNLDKESHKRYGYRYDSDYNQMVDVDEAIIITKK